MPQRYFVAPAIVSEAGGDRRVLLAGDEARHLVGVMRARVGDEVTLFDGSGSEFAARIVKLGKQAVDLEVVARKEISRELTLPLTLGVALPKGDRQKWLVEKATELGVTRLVPLVTERGVAQPVEAALDRLRRSVIEASKQCGRNRLLEIGQPQTLAEFAATAPPDALRLIAHPGGADVSTRTTGDELWAAVGPEGGFTDDEVAVAEHAGWQRVSLGRAILRVETAALALAAWWAMR
jgi:16S rRNA (uracil1498-N3)-methyltransferase